MRHNRTTERLRAYLEARPGVWISALELLQFGQLSSRTRISECRRWYGMDIENITRRRAGSGVKDSFYRYLVARTLFEDEVNDQQERV